MPLSHTIKLQRFETLIQRARQIAKREGLKRIAVAVAENQEVIEAVEDGRREEFCSGIFVGKRDKIIRICEQSGIDPNLHEILDVADEDEATYQAVKLGAEGAADVIMKGIVSTAKLLKTVLRKELNLKVSSLLSHVAVLDIPAYHKILAITDGGMVPSPTIKEKIRIVENAVAVMNSLDIPHPKVAILAATDSVNLVMQATTEAAIISKMSERTQFEGAIIDGPLPFDMAIANSPSDRPLTPTSVAGDADIIVVSNLETGNMLIKTLDYFAGARFGGLIVGSRIPLSVVSRADDAHNKLFSLALAVLFSDYLKAVHLDG